MKLIETTISETTVRMRYADDADASKATQSLEFVVPMGEARPEWHLPAIQRVALLTVQELVNAEIQAASKRVDRARGR
jgi:hypothetical protein